MNLICTMNAPYSCRLASPSQWKGGTPLLFVLQAGTPSPEGNPSGRDQNCQWQHAPRCQARYRQHSDAPRRCLEQIWRRRNQRRTFPSSLWCTICSIWVNFRVCVQIAYQLSVVYHSTQHMYWESKLCVSLLSLIDIWSKCFSFETWMML
jgi:hypothetical protein